MNKHIMTVAAVFLVLSIGGAAEAYSAHWCFQWQGAYIDSSTNQDYLNAPAGTTNYIDAKYSFAKVEIRTGLLTWQTLWNTWLDTSGCTGLVSVLPNKTYRFTQTLVVKRGDRIIEVHEDGVDWTGVADTEQISITTPSYLIPQFSYDAPIPPDSVNNRLMPALTQIIVNASTLDLPDGVDIDVSTWGSFDIPGDPVGLGCGSWCSGMGGSLYYACISNDWSNYKYNIAHEIGHAISKENDGPRWGDYWGSDGFYQATGVGNRCDCTFISGYSHCPTSREFTGSGQKEGFSHFIAAASYNTRTHVNGYFVFYKNLMQWLGTHGGVLPNGGGAGTIACPYEVELSDSDDVKWLQYECSPAANFQPHMSNEWDWVSFFWNLYADGGTNKYSVDEINTVWDGIPSDQRSYDCCAATDTDPGTGEYWVATNCVHLTVGSTCSPSYPHAFMIGKLWSADVTNHGVTMGLSERVDDLYNDTGEPLYNPAKFQHFVDTGVDAMVIY